VIDPANTVLDANGSPTPLSFNKYDDGDVVVEGLSMQLQWVIIPRTQTTILTLILMLTGA
jgi:hypothetical protein